MSFRPMHRIRSAIILLCGWQWLLLWLCADPAIQPVRLCAPCGKPKSRQPAGEQIKGRKAERIAVPPYGDNWIGGSPNGIRPTAYTPTGSQHKVATQWHADYPLPTQIDQANQGRKAERIAVPPYGGIGLADRLTASALRPMTQLLVSVILVFSSPVGTLFVPTRIKANFMLHRSTPQR